MCKVISIVNQKGGCSKTTSAVNIGIGLANAGKKVVLIDADAQGSLTASLGFQKPDELKVTLATIMAKTINEEEIDLSKVILHHEEGVDLVPGNIELSGLGIFENYIPSSIKAVEASSAGISIYTNMIQKEKSLRHMQR